jgi:hypothetical protein
MKTKTNGNIFVPCICSKFNSFRVRQQIFGRNLFSIIYNDGYIHSIMFQGLCWLSLISAILNLKNHYKILKHQNVIRFVAPFFLLMKFHPKEFCMNPNCFTSHKVVESL